MTNAPTLSQATLVASARSDHEAVGTCDAGKNWQRGSRHRKGSHSEQAEQSGECTPVVDARSLENTRERTCDRQGIAGVRPHTQGTCIAPAIFSEGSAAVRDAFLGYMQVLCVDVLATKSSLRPASCCRNSSSVSDRECCAAAVDCLLSPGLDESAFGGGRE